MIWVKIQKQDTTKQYYAVPTGIDAPPLAYHVRHHITHSSTRDTIFSDSPLCNLFSRLLGAVNWHRFDSLHGYKVKLVKASEQLIFSRSYIRMWTKLKAELKGFSPSITKCDVLKVHARIEYRKILENILENTHVLHWKKKNNTWICLLRMSCKLNLQITISFLNLRRVTYNTLTWYVIRLIIYVLLPLRMRRIVHFLHRDICFVEANDLILTRTLKNNDSD